MIENGFMSNKDIKAFTFFKTNLCPESFDRFTTLESIISYLTKMKSKLNPIHVMIFTRFCITANTIKKTQAYLKFECNIKQRIRKSSSTDKIPIRELLDNRVTIPNLVYLTVWKKCNP